MGFAENQKLAKDINSNTKKNTQSMETLLISLVDQLETTKKLVNTMAGKFVSKAYVDSGDAALDERVEELRDTLWENDRREIQPVVVDAYQYKTEEEYEYYVVAEFRVEDIDKFNYVFVRNKETFSAGDENIQMGLFDIKNNKFFFTVRGAYYDSSVAFNSKHFFYNSYYDRKVGLDIKDGVLILFSAVKAAPYISDEMVQYVYEFI